MSQTRIRAAFESRLAGWSQTSGVPVVWQNVAAMLVSDKHVRAFLIPAETVSLDLDCKHRGYRGVFQVSVLTRANVGPGEAEAIAREMDELFPVALRMTAAGLTVQVTAPMSAHNAVQETDWYMLPVSCRYEAHEFKD